MTTGLWACGEAQAPKEVPPPPKVVQDSSSKKLKKTVETPEPEPAPPVFDYDTLQWTDIHLVDESILIDMRYATTNNFVKEQLYNCGRCFLRPEAARALLKVQKVFAKQNLRLKMLDCFRPRPVQQKLWDKFQDPSYVTPPSKGSMHNRGLAVDLTLVDENGKELDMGTAFDFFGEEAHHTYTKLPEEVLQNRQLLKKYNGRSWV